MSKTATAADIRAWAERNPNRVPKGVNIPAKGRMPFRLVKSFQSHTGKTYVPTTPPKGPDTITVKVTHVQPSGRKVRRDKTVSLSEARTIVGARPLGRFGKSHRAALASALSD